MTSNKFAVLFLLIFTSLACGQKKSTEVAAPRTIVAGLPNGASLNAISGANVMTMTVNGSTCSASSYVNKPCVSITLCTPGTGTCQTINDILVDTGSYGLRVFRSLLTITPTQVNGANGNPLAECARFGDGTALWGPVQTMGIILGGQSAVSVPVQAIDSTFSTHPGNCTSPSVDPADAGFNGILGVGVFEEDCGNTCVNSANTNVYYTCTGGVCTGSRALLAAQVANPVARLPVDNNGVILQLPSIALGGAVSVSGYMVLGIGTQSNNIPGDVNAFAANPSTGQFTTTYQGSTYPSFIDSGSNAYYFPSTLPDCGGSLPGWYCPSTTSTETAVNLSTSQVTFLIGNLFSMLTLHPTSNVFLEIGGSGGGGSYFDWGLPFYVGRNVYLGIERKSSTLASGTYWAY